MLVSFFELEAHELSMLGPSGSRKERSFNIVSRMWLHVLRLTGSWPSCFVYCPLHAFIFSEDLQIQVVFRKTKLYLIGGIVSDRWRVQYTAGILARFAEAKEIRLAELESLRFQNSFESTCGYKL